MSNPLPEEVTFVIWAPGDPSVGIFESNAEVTMFVDVHDAREMAYVKTKLAKCFSHIWGEQASVVTTDEIEAEEDD